MSTLVTRAGKGSPLTHNEVDTNFTNLNTDKLEKANNLSDLTSASTARTNLGLSTVAATGAYADLSGKPTLGSAAAAATTDFDPAGAAVALAIALG